MDMQLSRFMRAHRPGHSDITNKFYVQIHRPINRIVISCILHSFPCILKALHKFIVKVMSSPHSVHLSLFVTVVPQCHNIHDETFFFQDNMSSREQYRSLYCLALRCPSSIRLNISVLCFTIIQFYCSIPLYFFLIFL